MSPGNWLYYKRKFKLVVLPASGISSNKKSILALTYERNWELPEGYSVNYFDVNAALTIITTPNIVIEREFNDGKALYEGLYERTLKKKSPKAFWLIDAHLSDKKRISYCNNFDFVFVAHSSYIEFVKRNTTCKNIFWLPLCYPEKADTIKENTIVPKYPVSFIGRYGGGFDERNAMINFLKAVYNEDFFVATDYKNSRMLIQQSKITTNHSIKDDLNFRVFEALGYGTELVTNYVADLDKIEGLKERLHHFSNYSELKKHIDALLCNKPQAKHTIKEVQQWIKKKHTMKNRLQEMLQMIDTSKQIEYK